MPRMEDKSNPICTYMTARRWPRRHQEFQRHSRCRPVAFCRNPVTRGLSGSSQDQVEGSRLVFAFVMPFSMLFSHRSHPRSVQLRRSPPVVSQPTKNESATLPSGSQSSSFAVGSHQSLNRVLRSTIGPFSLISCRQTSSAASASLILDLRIASTSAGPDQRMP